MSATQTSNIYESEFLRAVTGPAVRPGGLALTARAMEFCQFPPEARLLDVGCGAGATVEYLRNHYHLDASGVDISTRLLVEGKARDKKLPLAHASAEHLPFAGGSLDGILCECVLSLFTEPDRALREFHRVLGPDGKLILSDIYLRGQGEECAIREETVDGCLRGARSACFTEKMLREAGFEILLWEDHTPLLKELAARLVLAHGSMDALWGEVKDAGCAGSGLATMAALRPGYYLLVARKE
ncbi:MAG TPA: class I SAM-dependent methyltransferase [Geobacteraceae bacterium]|nr:class I SAM-dependent methyltransferase [Geobacteraceae bacterium]